MSDFRGTVAITGAYGYLGSLLRGVLDERGWKTHALVRQPRAGDRASVWTLETPRGTSELAGFDALVHCAYDFRPRHRDAVWRANVDGSVRLIEAAHDAGVQRIVGVSSMSAYHGTTQIYGRAKLAMEEAVTRVGGVAVRPGLVYGDDPGGMVGALLRVARLPVVPLIGANSLQFPARDEDVTRAIAAVLEEDTWTPGVICLSQPEAMPFRDVLRTLAARSGQHPHFVSLPWQPVYYGLRLTEALGIRAPFRADSVLGLVRPAPRATSSRDFAGMPEGFQTLR